MNNSNSPASLETICEGLKECYTGVELPSAEVLNHALGRIIKEKRIFQTVEGYFIVKPDFSGVKQITDSTSIFIKAIEDAKSKRDNSESPKRKPGSPRKSRRDQKPSHGTAVVRAMDHPPLRNFAAPPARGACTMPALGRSQSFRDHEKSKTVTFSPGHTTRAYTYRQRTSRSLDRMDSTSESDASVSCMLTLSRIFRKNKPRRRRHANYATFCAQFPPDNLFPFWDISINGITPGASLATDDPQIATLYQNMEQNNDSKGALTTPVRAGEGSPLTEHKRRHARKSPEKRGGNLTPKSDHKLDWSRGGKHEKLKQGDTPVRVIDNSSKYAETLEKYQNRKLPETPKISRDRGHDHSPSKRGEGHTPRHHRATSGGKDDRRNSVPDAPTMSGKTKPEPSTTLEVFGPPPSTYDVPPVATEQRKTKRHKEEKEEEYDHSTMNHTMVTEAVVHKRNSAVDDSHGKDKQRIPPPEWSKQQQHHRVMKLKKTGKLNGKTSTKIPVRNGKQDGPTPSPEKDGGQPGDISVSQRNGVEQKVPVEEVPADAPPVREEQPASPAVKGKDSLPERNDDIPRLNMGPPPLAPPPVVQTFYDNVKIQNSSVADPGGKTTSNAATATAPPCDGGTTDPPGSKRRVVVGCGDSDSSGPRHGGENNDSLTDSGVSSTRSTPSSAMNRSVTAPVDTLNTDGAGHGAGHGKRSSMIDTLMKGPSTPDHKLDVVDGSGVNGMGSVGCSEQVTTLRVDSPDTASTTNSDDVQTVKEFSTKKEEIYQVLGVV